MAAIGAVQFNPEMSIPAMELGTPASAGRVPTREKTILTLDSSWPVTQTFNRGGQEVAKFSG